MPRWGLQAMAVALAAALASGPACGAGGGSRPSDAGDGKARVVAGFYPLAFAAERVAGEHAEVLDVTPAGSEPHDVELTPTQIDRIEDADLVLYLGGGFQPAVERAARRRGDDGSTVDVLARIGVDGPDPHFWLDPTLMSKAVAEIERAVAAALPREAAAGVAARAAALRAELADLDRRLASGLRDCERRTFVTSHDSFGFLARRYGLESRAIAGLSPDVEPDPRRLAELADLVRSSGTTTVFTEELASPRVAAALARETGARTAVLSPIEGLARDAAAGTSYLSLMDANREALVAALGCRAP